MARFLKHIVLFLLFAGAVYLCLLYAAGIFIPQHLQKNLYRQPIRSSFVRERIHEVSDYRQADLLIVGPSLAHRGIDPRVFRERGYRALLLTCGGQTPVQARIFLERYLDSVQPKRVLLVVYPELYVKDRIEPSIDLLLSDRVDGAIWRTALLHKNLRVVNTLLYTTMRQWSGAQPPALRSGNEDDVYIPGGMQQRRVLTYNQDLPTACIPGPGLPLNPMYLEELDACLALLRSRNVPVLLLQMPQARARYQCYRYKEEVDSLFHSRASYWNLNGQVALDDSLDFYDNAHLNARGARTFTGVLCTDLERAGYLKHGNLQVAKGK
ncbi:hypothetical protein [Flaviaesturariibacter aridisoli]|uniref:SGNH/GDSL hydrolase family protein n=1 Tax=Flaviaesturariibacter aridisoli TaxID=2545761 RepID=A0A4R4E6Y8_9BACT|nr:hypothetical protein [Flaviaesturariibacter aridisoli]TCZ73488.1 hypothetical protein E0486_05880 [Flaviaesturariibacter aridisoli]